jgi:transcription initiation factor TFIIIB Brf1 subunit/transcription initiation factor TFIIB
MIMEKTQHEQKPDEFSILVTRFEVNLISNIVYIALNHLQLDDYSHKEAQEFIAKMQKSALSISRQPTH